MVAFAPSQLPVSVDTVEKLEVWAATVLSHLLSDTTAIETAGSVDRVAQSQPWFIVASNPPVWRVISRTSIPVSANWQRQGKIWQHAQNLSTASIPADFTS